MGEYIDSAVKEGGADGTVLVKLWSTAQFVMFVLKITGILNWSWWIILIPAELLAALILLYLAAIIYM